MFLPEKLTSDVSVGRDLQDVDCCRVVQGNLVLLWFAFFVGSHRNSWCFGGNQSKFLEKKKGVGHRFLKATIVKLHEPPSCLHGVLRYLHPTDPNHEGVMNYLKLKPKPYGHMAMGQKPNRTPSEHPNPTTKIGSKMGGEFTYPRMVPLVLTHSHILNQRAHRIRQASTTTALKPRPFLGVA